MTRANIIPKALNKMLYNFRIFILLKQKLITFEEFSIAPLNNSSICWFRCANFPWWTLNSFDTPLNASFRSSCFVSLGTCSSFTNVEVTTWSASNIGFIAARITSCQNSRSNLSPFRSNDSNKTWRHFRFKITLFEVAICASFPNTWAQPSIFQAQG